MSTEGWCGEQRLYPRWIPRRGPIDPHGYYHVGSRGSYGQPLFRTREQHELFLRLYQRAATKYGWATLDWTLMGNHHHFVMKLRNGGLSEGMRELHGGFSRRIHTIYGVTGQGHLVRHAFFARRLTSEADVLATCRYVDLNFSRASGRPPEQATWSGYRVLVGLEHPRPFHRPSELLGLISQSPKRAQRTWAEFVKVGLDQLGHDPSPNDGGPFLVRSQP